MRDDRERLRDILDSIARIERYAVQGQSVFNNDELIQVWMIHHLQIIGEAARALSDDLIARYTEINWPAIVELRNIVVHEYFRVDLNIIWSIIKNNLPDFKQQVEIILQDLEG